MDRTGRACGSPFVCLRPHQAERGRWIAMGESIVVVGAALSADVDAPTERVYSAPGARHGQPPEQTTGERAGRWPGRARRFVVESGYARVLKLTVAWIRQAPTKRSIGVSAKAGSGFASGPRRECGQRAASVRKPHRRRPDPRRRCFVTAVRISRTRQVDALPAFGLPKPTRASSGMRRRCGFPRVGRGAADLMRTRASGLCSSSAAALQRPALASDDARPWGS